MRDPYDVATWHFLNCYFNSVCHYSLVVDKLGIRKFRFDFDFKCILVDDWQNLWKKYFIWVQALATSPN
jgi:hypothetical protein